MQNATELAWLQLTHEKIRFMVAIAGIAFSCMLIFVQMGIKDSLYESSTAAHRALKADLVMLSPHLQTINSPQGFARVNLYRCLSNKQVKQVAPLYIARAKFKNPESKQERELIVYGAIPGQMPFDTTVLPEEPEDLRLLNRVIFDSGSRPEFGDISKILNEEGKIRSELNKKSIVITGSFKLGASFSSDGNLLCSDSSFLRFFPEHKKEQLELGLILLKDGASINEVKDELMQNASPSVIILSKEEFSKRERHYWAQSTGIGYVFGLGVVVGFLVGLVLVYQVMYSDISNHMAEYATLKAIGYTNRYLAFMLIKEALILSVFGYIPSFFLSLFIYKISALATILPIHMTVDRAVLVFFLSILISVLSALVSMKKLKEADPADVF